MNTRSHDPISFARELEKLLIGMNISPSTIDLPKLTRDMLAGVEDAERKAPRQIANELGKRFRFTLPAYRKARPFGPRIPASGNVNPHVPDVEDAAELTVDREDFHVDQWLDAVGSLSSWAHENTGEPATSFRVEQCLADLLIEFPAVPVGARTARALAGRLGPSQLVEVLRLDYPAGSNWRYYPEDADEDQGPALDLTGGPKNWGL